jgi:hypothetical protein
MNRKRELRCPWCKARVLAEDATCTIGHAVPECAPFALEAAIGGLALVEQRDDRAKDFIAGKVEGLQSALYLVQRAGVQ